MILSKIKQTFLLNIFLLIITFTLSAQERTRYVVNEDIHLYKIHDSVYLHLTWDTLGSFGRTELLTHTIELATAAKNKEN